MAGTQTTQTGHYFLISATVSAGFCRHSCVSITVCTANNAAAVKPAPHLFLRKLTFNCLVCLVVLNQLFTEPPSLLISYQKSNFIHGSEDVVSFQVLLIFLSLKVIWSLLGYNCCIWMLKHTENLSLTHTHYGRSAALSQGSCSAPQSICVREKPQHWPEGPHSFSLTFTRPHWLSFSLYKLQSVL